MREEDTDDSKSGIYYINKLGTGKYYVGKSFDMEQRLYNHRNSLNRGVHFSKKLQNSWTKHGEAAFEFGILKFCPVKHLLREESALIWLYRYPGTDRAYYNTCLEGTADNENHVRAVVSINKDTGDIERYPSLKAAAKLGFSAGLISNACRGKIYVHKNHYWKYEIDYDPSTFVPPVPKGWSEETRESHRQRLKERQAEMTASSSTGLAKEKRRVKIAGKSFTTPEMRKLHSERMSGEGNPFFGKRHSDAMIEQISNKKRGRKLTPEQKENLKSKRAQTKINKALLMAEEAANNLEQQLNSEQVDSNTASLAM